MQFWLGTHMTSWLSKLDVPMMLSHRQLAKRVSRYPRALGPWVLDSGAYSELALFGEWRTTTRQYVASVRRYEHEIDSLAWAAPMDWTCDPDSLTATQRTVRQHQRSTVDNFLRLEGEGPFIPVLQGWTRDDFMRHVEMYDRAGVTLVGRPIVGLGSIASRADSPEVLHIADELRDLGLRLHGFGLKRRAISAAAAHVFTSIDSLAWSYAARRQPALDGCVGHKACQNCPTYALQWRDETLAILEAAGAFQRRML